MSKKDAAASAHSVSAAYILLENPKKSTNQGPVLRCAAAFGVKQVAFVGYEKCSVDGSHGASKHVDMVAFPTAEQAIQRIRDEAHSEGRLVSFVGLLGGIPVSDEKNGALEECFDVITDDETTLAQIRNKNADSEYASHTTMLQAKSYPVYAPPFEYRKDCCFILNQKGRFGLSSSLARHCDMFIHIPHRIMDSPILDRPLLDLPACMSIALHHFTEWAQYDELTLAGHKFDVKRRSHTDDSESIKRAVEAKRLGRLEKELEVQDVDTLGALFASTGGEKGDY